MQHLGDAKCRNGLPHFPSHVIRRQLLVFNDQQTVTLTIVTGKGEQSFNCNKCYYVKIWNCVLVLTIHGIFCTNMRQTENDTKLVHHLHTDVSVSEIMVVIIIHHNVRPTNIIFSEERDWLWY